MRPQNLSLFPEAQPKRATVHEAQSSDSPALISQGNWDAVVLGDEISEREYLSLADAVLVSAIQEAFGLSRGGAQFQSHSRHALLARRWIEDSPFDEETYPFSFKNCCVAAGVDPDELRDQLKALVL